VGDQVRGWGDRGREKFTKAYMNNWRKQPKKKKKIRKRKRSHLNGKLSLGGGGTPKQSRENRALIKQEGKVKQLNVPLNTVKGTPTRICLPK